MQLKVKILRKATITTHPFTDYFQGFDKVEAVQRIFEDKTSEVLNNLRVEFFGRKSYMGVSDDDGHLLVSAHYLNHGDSIDLYLDVIHELVHVKQFMEGKKLFDDHYSYVDRPTEIEAYAAAVAEARRLGLSDERILQYLKTEWMDEEELKKLASKLNVRIEKTTKKK